MTFRDWLFSPLLAALARSDQRQYDIGAAIVATLDELVELTKGIAPAIDKLEAAVTAATSGALTAEQQAKVDEAFANVRDGLADAADGVDEANVPPPAPPAPEVPSA